MTVHVTVRVGNPLRTKSICCSMDLNCSTVTCRQFLKLDIRSMKFSCKAYTSLPVVPGLGFRVTGNLSFHRYHVTALSKIAHGAARCKGFRRFFVLGFVQCLWRGIISASLGYTQRCVSYYSTGRRGLQGFSLLSMRTAGWAENRGSGQRGTLAHGSKV